MAVTILRLLRTERLRLIILSLSMTLWFLLIMAVVKNATTLVATKTDAMGDSISKGFGIGQMITPDAVIAQMAGVSFSHPIVLALIGAVTVGLGARSCQGELERGTLDITLSRAISRTRYLLGYIVVMVVSVCILMTTAGVSMVALDRMLDVPGTIYVDRAVQACLNGTCVFIAFGAIAILMSVVLGRRFSATFTTVGILVAMFALTFAENVWSTPVLDWLGPLSLFHWFQPGNTLSGFTPGAANYVVPLAATLVMMAIALWRFERRDL